MRGQGWPNQIWIHALLLFFACIQSNDVTGQLIDWPASPAWKNDAELTDLFFIDRQTGWIVGDQGTVLKTSDGGRNWDLVSLGVQCRLESVFFQSQNVGWIAGGFRIPNAASSRAVIFRTLDGGRTWMPVSGLTIPKINKIVFQNPTDGWAIGDGNALIPNGIFRTTDGGRTWSGNTRGPLHGWQTASQFGGRMVLANRQGSIGIYDSNNSSNEIQASYFPESSPTAIHELAMTDAENGVCVGDTGSILVTKNAGLSWHPVPNAPNMGMIDLRTLHLGAGQVWFAGSPGTYVYSYDLETQELQKFRTPLSAPITRMQFIDDSYAWLISSGGDILHSTDKGKSWSVQRRGQDGLAFLQIARLPMQFSPQLYSRFTGQEGMIGGALLVQDLRAANHSARHSAYVQAQKTGQALFRLGCSVLELMVQVSSDQSLADENARVHERLVRIIRTHRPRVIVLPAQDDMPGGLEFRALLMTAVVDAGDRRSIVEHFSVLGLEPWDVSKVVLHSQGSVGDIRLSANEYLSHMGCLLNDHVAASQILLNQHHHFQDGIAITSIYQSPFVSGFESSLFKSIERVDPRIPKRAQAARSAGNLTQMRVLANKRKTVQALLEFARNASVADSAQLARTRQVWLTKLAELVGGLNKPAAGVWLFQIASQLERDGLIDLASQTHGYLARNYRTHPMSISSLQWLLRDFSSAELGHLSHRAAQGPVKTLPENQPTPGPLTSQPVTTVNDGVARTEWKLIPTDNAADPRNDATTGQAIVFEEQQSANDLNRRYLQARSVAQSLDVIDPASGRSEPLMLTRSLLNEKLEPGLALDKQLKTIASQIAFPNASQAARREVFLRNRPNQINQLGVQVSHAIERPWLDGHFKDQNWLVAAEHGSRIALFDQTGSPTGDEIYLSGDDQFLFLAIRCRKRKELAYPKNTNRRIRDTNLLASDRVEIAIDVDRDSTVCYLLTIDSRGRLAESCADNINWNPDWFVSSRQTDEFWMAEVAIELDELVSNRQQPIWQMSFSRHAGRQWLAAWYADKRGISQEAVAVRDSAHQAVLEHRMFGYQFPVEAFGFVRMPWLADRKTDETGASSLKR